jgi:3-dehydroquinate synthase
MMNDLKITSFKGVYELFFVDDFADRLLPELAKGDVFVVDKNVYGLHQASIDKVIAGHKVHFVSPDENAKSYQAVEPLISQLIQDGFRKNHRLVAIGGGITQDITAFIASILYRGVDWIFIPTNLLSQCDSCIGSKTSINFGPYKNQIGGFHPPIFIINDKNFLTTLGRDDIRSGIGEMLHYFLIAGRQDFNAILSSYDTAVTDLSVLSAFIHRSLAIKKAMIEVDEFDKGPRNIFNYGHSFGHAIESFTNYSLQHGIAISFGMDLANHVSAALGYITAAEAAEMRIVLEKNWTPDTLKVDNLEDIISLLKKDKKNVDADIRLVLTRGLGDMFLTTVEINEVFRNTLRKCFDYYAAKVNL